MAPKIVCLSWALSGESGLIVGFKDIEEFCHEMFDSGALLVGQYVAFDMSVLMANFKSLWLPIWTAYHEDRVTCVAIREKLIDIAKGEFKRPKKNHNPYSLKEMVERRLDLELKKEDTWRLRYNELDGIPLSEWPQDAKDYAILDSEVLIPLYEDQCKRINELPTEYEDARADLGLRLASCWGLETDQKKVFDLWTSTSRRMNELADELISTGIVVRTKPKNKDLFPQKFEPLPQVKKSLDKIRQLIIETYPGDPPLTPKDQVQTSANVLEDCQSEILQKLVEFNKLEKRASTYISKLVNNKTIHPWFLSIGAASVRTSCANPNLQNQPREPGIRECFVARSGYCYLSCDFDSQEMRTLAQSCLDIVGFSRLAERYKDDVHFDPHLEFAATLGNIPIDEAKERYLNGDEEIKELRQQTKIANFGLPGGLGAKTFVSYAKGWGVEISYQRAMMLKEAWLTQWPEMEVYFKHVANLVGPASYGYMTIPQSGFVRGAVGYTDCCNGYFQTLAAHASKKAMFEVCKHCYCNPKSSLFGSRPVLFIHDEIILETPLDLANDAAKEIEQIMIEAMSIYTPDIPVAASATLMNYWSKQAKRTFDEQGRLIPWTC